jgi:uncharacterized repeat protein (TIGR01451 family)
VAVLGGLGYTQYQHDSRPADTHLLDISPPPAMGPPMPIAADSPAFVPLAELAARPAVDAQPQAFGGDPAAVQQVAHEESFALPPQTYITSADQPEPSDDSIAAAGPNDPASGPSGFALPNWSDQPAAPEAAPQAVNYGSPDDMPAAAPPTSPNGDEMPAANFAAFPVNQLRGTPAAMTPPVASSTLRPVADVALVAPAADPGLPPNAFSAIDPAQSAPGQYDPAQSAPGQYDPAQYALGQLDPPSEASNEAPQAFDPTAMPSADPAGGPTGFAGMSPVPSSTAPSAATFAVPQSARFSDPSADPATFSGSPAEPDSFGDAAAAPTGPAANAFLVPVASASPEVMVPVEAPSVMAPAPFSAQPPLDAGPPAVAGLAAPSMPAEPMSAALTSPNFPGSDATGRSVAQPQSPQYDAQPGIAPADDERLLNEPGDRRLEGIQAPSVVIHKRAPDQVQVGKPATFVIQVQNVGVVEAADVQIHDRIPAGMTLIESTPQAQRNGDHLVWQLGALEPGGERTVSLQLVPDVEGELGSVARVSFEAAASVRTVSTRPALKVTQRAPAQVLIGQQLEIELEVSNPGTGAATGVTLQTDVPEGLEHPKGRQLDNLIGTLGPGEVRRQVLRLRATAPGQVNSEIRITGDDGLSAIDTTAIQIIAPELAIEVEGPTRRYLERQATYQIHLANVGSADATNVEIIAYLDRGFSFVGTEFQGQYDPNRHAVYWSLAELPPEARGAVPLTLLPIEAGERAIRLEARGDLNLVSRHEKKVTVDAPAELTFSITDDADPIEIGSTATYEIRILNRGAREDGDVNLKVQLPDGLELVSSETDASTDGQGLVVFAPHAVIPAKGEVVHRIRVKGTKPGTQIVKAIVTSSQAPTAVTKEESTTVYADN